MLFSPNAFLGLDTSFPMACGEAVGGLRHTDKHERSHALLPLRMEMVTEGGTYIFFQARGTRTSSAAGLSLAPKESTGQRGSSGSRLLYLALTVTDLLLLPLDS